jgi:hypothetical protein
MKDKVLIDTSAWIVSFRRSGHDKLKRKVVEVLNTSSAATANIIIMELLQGCRDQREYEEMRSRLEALDLLALNEDVWETAYSAGFSLRKKGITVPSLDIIIASIARVHDCTLLHHDRHFNLVAKHLGTKTIDFLSS